MFGHNVNILRFPNVRRDGNRRDHGTLPVTAQPARIMLDSDIFVCVSRPQQPTLPTLFHVQEQPCDLHAISWRVRRHCLLPTRVLRLHFPRARHRIFGFIRMPEVEISNVLVKHVSKHVPHYAGKVAQRRLAILAGGVCHFWIFVMKPCKESALLSAATLASASVCVWF